MDKCKHRQSAVNDFMQSLDHLDELLGDTAESVVLGDGPQVSESDDGNNFPLKSTSSVSTANQTRRTLVNPDADA